MSHPDDDALAGYALGEESLDGTAALADHVSGCEPCRTSVAALRAVDVALTDAAHEPVVLEAPPADVWRAVLAQTLEPAPRPRPATARSPRRRPVLAAALLGLTGLVVGGGVGFLVGNDRSPSTPTPTPPRQVASGALQALPGHTASGSVRLYETASHRWSLRVHISGARAGDGFVEAWLFEPGTTRMIALGMMTRGTQDFEVPTDVDITTYRAVDISLEPLDGDPAHSTDSVAQGSLSR